MNVEAEPNFDGSLVLLEPPSDPSLVPFAGPTVVSENARVGTDHVVASMITQQKCMCVAV